MDFYLQNLHFHTYLAVNAKYCVYSNGNIHIIIKKRTLLIKRTLFLYNGDRKGDDNMLMEQATNVRKQWSTICDSVIHNKPKLIKRTRDKM